MDFKKQPKWVQEYIEKIERAKETAIRTLNEFVDNQTESQFSYDDMVCLNENNDGPSVKEKFVQTYKMKIVNHGVELNVMIRDKSIELSWGTPNYGSGEVAFIPLSFQQAKIVSNEHMRCT